MRISTKHTPVCPPVSFGPGGFCFIDFEAVRVYIGVEKGAAGKRFSSSNG